VHWEPAGGVEVLERWAHRVQLTWG